VDGPDSIYPDGLIAEEGLNQLEILAARNEPFFLAIGLIRPHLPFGAPKSYLDLYEGVELPPIQHPEKPQGNTTWHDSGEFMGYDRWGRDPNLDAAFAEEVRLHYAACVSYADKHVGDILSKLKETGADTNTVVVLWGDHGWHLGEHGIWGKHSLFEESLLAPLIIYYPAIGKAGRASEAVVESVDIFPTLCELTELPTPDFAQGISLAPLLDDPAAEGHVAIGYYNGRKTIRTATHRLIEHEDGVVELYDHTAPEGETENIAASAPVIRAELQKQLSNHLND
jgi:iduronate 2-sulfatase